MKAKEILRSWMIGNAIVVTSQVYSVEYEFIGGTLNVNQPGIYGDRGAASDQNCPGSRTLHKMCINPLNGNILVFGGFGFATTDVVGRKLKSTI